MQALLLRDRLTTLEAGWVAVFRQQVRSLHPANTPQRVYDGPAVQLSRDLATPLRMVLPQHDLAV